MAPDVTNLEIEARLRPRGARGGAGLGVRDSLRTSRACSSLSQSISNYVHPGRNTINGSVEPGLSPLGRVTVTHNLASLAALSLTGTHWHWQTRITGHMMTGHDTQGSII